MLINLDRFGSKNLEIQLVCPKIRLFHQNWWKITKNRERMFYTHGLCIASLWTHRRVSQMIFWDSRLLKKIETKNMFSSWRFSFSDFFPENLKILKLSKMLISSFENLWIFKIYQKLCVPRWKNIINPIWSDQMHF